jgi:cytochrome c oxidase subunit 4
MTDTEAMTDTEVAALEAGGGALVPATPGTVESHAAHAHPQPRQYVLIAVVLVIITAVEVAVSYIDRDTLGPNWIIVLLGSMALVKFFLVVSWYMHLKTDLPILRRFFMVGLIGAPILYLVIALVLNALMSDHNTPPTLLP